MKRLFILLLLSLMVVPKTINAQDNKLLRVAMKSSREARDKYENGQYKEAVQDYNIVIETIPAKIDSRRHLLARIEAIVDVIDIYFNKTVDFKKGCGYIEVFNKDINTIKNKGLLRTSELLEYHQIQQEYIADYIPKCENYEQLNDDMDNFKNVFDKEFEDKKN